MKQKVLINNRITTELVIRFVFILVNPELFVRVSHFHRTSNRRNKNFKQLGQRQFNIYHAIWYIEKKKQLTFPINIRLVFVGLENWY